MPVVRELFGFPIHSSGGRELRKKAICPFTNSKCDGGGNRDMARLSFDRDSSVRARFDASVLEDGGVSCAICSIGSEEKNWIICPRRLLNFSKGTVSEHHKNLLKTVCRTADFRKGTKVLVWDEITISAKSGSKKFKYRFDYVLREELADGQIGPPVIVEIMTCSTSGGNKRKGTDIATSFSKALLAEQGEEIRSPNVNVRQVWSRMAGQLIVKSQAANQWGGMTIWVVQDLLADYISSNTGLNLDSMKSQIAGEVNLVSSDGTQGDSGLLYSGPISSAVTSEPSFSDILKGSYIPKFDEVASKFLAPPDGSFEVPE